MSDLERWAEWNDRHRDDDLIDDEREAARRAERERLLRVARGTLTAAEAALREGLLDMRVPTERVAWLVTERNRAERALRELLGAAP